MSGPIQVRGEYALLALLAAAAMTIWGLHEWRGRYLAEQKLRARQDADELWNSQLRESSRDLPGLYELDGTGCICAVEEGGLE